MVTECDQLQQQLKNAEAEFEMLHKKSKNKAGPVTAYLEDILQRHNIKRQAYHSGAFLGNHIHHALTGTVINELSCAAHTVLDTRVQDADATTADKAEMQALKDQATALQQCYTSLLTQYARCRKIFSSKKAI